MKQKDEGTRDIVRVLPWRTADGKRCLLRSGEPGGVISRLADSMEATQLGIGERVLDHAREILSNPRASETELRYLSRQLVECLGDALRVAESRGDRLGVDGADDDLEESEEGPTLPPESFG